MHTTILLAAAMAACQPATDGDITIDSALVIRPAMRSGRAAVFTDPVEHMLVRGTWKPPVDGDTLGGGEQNTWMRLAAGDNGVLSHRALAGGYAYATLLVPEERIALLDARGHRHVYVNGEARAGDVYNLGTLRLPIKLREGENEFLFRGGRGQIRAVITEPPAPVYIETRDMTLPDLVAGEAGEGLLAGIIIGNATETWAEGLVVHTLVNQRLVSRSEVPAIGPLTVHKAAVEMAVPPATEGDAVTVELELWQGGQRLDEQQVVLRIRRADQIHRRTFRSQIDGSVQYYAVTPRTPAAPAGPRPALVLSLHGASVEAIGQAAAYTSKDWCHIVAPTNRRPFGFDWEDWGRQDALEVLHDASARYEVDPSRVYLTGHSMGGHGAWQLGVHYPGLFAAMAPSAGWPDFWSYTGAPEWPEGTPVERMLHRAANASRTRLLVRNLDHGGANCGGVYVLHGDADDNVPVSQARLMRGLLGEFHTNFVYQEQPGAGHWWGNQCVDWPPLFAYLQRHVRPDDHQVTQIDFSTVNPAISCRSYWGLVQQQARALEPSRLQAALDAPARRLTVTTENITRVAFDLRPFVETQDGEGRPVLEPGRPVTIDIDGQRLEHPWPGGAAVLGLARSADGSWAVAGPYELSHKHPGRAGSFKEAFKNNVMLVVGTTGTPEEQAWSYQKARYDAETFLYRGNATPRLIRDWQLKEPAVATGNVIVYGTPASSAAFEILGLAPPLDIRPGLVRIGDREIEGDDLACLFIQPRPGTIAEMVAVVGGTGLSGMRLTMQLPYFISGAGFPDWLVVGADMLEIYTGGVRGAGFFANDWSLGSDAAWQDE